MIPCSGVRRENDCRGIKSAVISNSLGCGALIWQGSYVDLSYFRTMIYRFGKRGRSHSPMRSPEANHDFDAVGSYQHFTQAPEHVDERTWGDLDMDSVFLAMDRTKSLPGRQILYAQLHRYADESILAERACQQTVLRAHPDHITEIQSAVTGLDGPDTRYLTPLLFSPFPSRPRWRWILYICSALPAVFLLGSFLIPKLLMATLAALMVNGYIYMTYGQRVGMQFAGFAQVDRLLSVVQALGRKDNPHSLPQLHVLKSGLERASRLRRRLGFLVADRNAMSELGQAVFAYLNLAFLVDIISFFRASVALQGDQAFIIELLESVGSLDAACSVAVWVGSLRLFCSPQFSASPRFCVSGMYHPLILNPIGSTVDLGNRSAVIAGPNMAGKTSFIRSAGINLLLAQTLNVCLAEKAVLPRFRIRSAIRREDRLSEGESYFFAEIRQILEFVETPGHSHHVFLIDEIFRGTNTIERIAGSAAVLRYLAKSHLVLVTTHDMELGRLLADCFELFHFSDRIVDGRYGFDYQLRGGPVRSRNAIKLLSLVGFPDSIVADANETVKTLTTSSEAELSS